MDKNEYNLKVEEMRIAMHNRDYDKAAGVADSLEFKKEKDNDILTLIADAYEITHQYSKAKEALIIAYENTNVGRQLAYRLCLISIKTKEFDEAQEFYEDFVEMAPRDNSKYILQYKIAKGHNLPIENLIEILEEYVKIDMEEKWAYELAKLYHLVGDEESCIDTCDEISLWFAEGKYVNKAMELKMLYRPLTKIQQANYDAGKKTNTEEKFVEEHLTEEVNGADDNDNIDTEKNKKEYLDKDIKDSDGVEEETEEELDEIETADLPDLGTTKMFAPGDVADIAATRAFSPLKDQEVSENMAKVAPIIMPDEFEVQPMVGNGLDTMDIQAVVAQGMDEIMNNDKNAEDNIETPDNIGMTLDNIYTLEGDGQIGLDIEDQKPQEKQITGQLSIEEVLKNLQKRGILKPDTVEQTVKVMDDAAVVADKAAEEVEKAKIEAKENIVREIKPEDVGLKPEDIDKENDDLAGVKKALESFAAEAVASDVFIPDLDTEAIEEEIKFQTGEIELESVELPKEIKPMETDLKESDYTDDEPDNDDEEIEQIIKKTLQEDEIDSTVSGNMPEKSVIENDLSEQETSKSVPEEIELTNEELEELDLLIGIDKKDQSIQVPEDDVPIFDLSFDAPHRDASNDRGSMGIYEDMVSISDLGRTTEPLPTKEEIEDAMKLPLEDSETADEILEVEETENIEETEDIEESHDLENQNEQEENDIREETDGLGEKMSDEKIEETETNENDEIETKKVVPEKPVGSANVSFELTDEDMEVFSNYTDIQGLDKAIQDTIENLVVNYVPNGLSETGNVMILGDEKSGKTTLAIDIIRIVNKKRGRKGRRIAKIDANILNSRGLRGSLKKLIGSDLIVENAGNLAKFIIAEALEISKFYTDNMLLVFEGEPVSLKNMLKDNEELGRMFDNVITIKEYNVKEWVVFAKKYAAERGYMVDDMGTLALYKTIDDWYGNNQRIDQDDVEAIMDKAVSRAKRKIGRKIVNVFSSKNDENGLDILRESDFDA